jgi:nitrate reductase cytochrome c-type subunit
MKVRNRTSCAPRIPHAERLEDAWQLDYNTGTPFLQGHSQENNIAGSGVKVSWAHVVEEEQNRHNKKP